MVTSDKPVISAFSNIHLHIGEEGEGIYVYMEFYDQEFIRNAERIMNSCNNVLM